MKFGNEKGSNLSCTVSEMNPVYSYSLTLLDFQVFNQHISFR